MQRLSKGDHAFFVRPWLASIPDHLVDFPAKSEITLLDQAIPAPFHLPTFETIEKGGLRSALLQLADAKTNGSFPMDDKKDPFNPSGKRVKQYREFVELSFDLLSFRHFTSVLF